MTTKNKALEQAIATLRKAYVVRLGSHPWTDMLDETIKACKEALAETNEPVGEIVPSKEGYPLIELMQRIDDVMQGLGRKDNL